MKRFAVFGTGYWARYQIAAWQELENCQCIALYNRTPAKAEVLAKRFSIPAVYDDPEELLQEEKPDFVDIIAHVSVHSQLVKLAARYGVPVICQKPMAPDFETGREMLDFCRKAGVPFLIHENWRWQEPIRAVKRVLEEGRLGKAFRARISYSNSAPVFDNHPYLKELDRFILNDMGSHILDVARFLFGEAEILFCRTDRIHSDINGEDVATVLLGMKSGVTVTCELSYASRVEHDRFNETFILVECQKGSVELGPDFRVAVSSENGTLSRRHVPRRYDWANPSYAAIHPSIVRCNENLLDALLHRKAAETTAEDNMETMRLVSAAYDSARTGKLVHLGEYKVF